ncbi:MAG TPA: MMPL family transporter, partial [Verrucomicrobiae bacterium]|nr:MMPL family transporter [Verrucomicrobiae bacterium]
MRRLRAWFWWLLLIPISLGLLRLRFDTDVLNLLPARVPAVAGLKIYQQHFTSNHELIIAVNAPDAETAQNTARLITEALRGRTNLVSEVIWEAPWLEHPAQAAELIAYLWLNQPPQVFRQLAERLAPTNLPAELNSARTRLATSMSPPEIARLSYDPFGLTQLPKSTAASAPRFGEGQEMFASEDGSFRILFVQTHNDLNSYRECIRWLNAIKKTVNAVVSSNKQLANVTVGYTGQPVFVADISSSMEHDMTTSVIGTSLLIAVLFWLAHRRLKPMLWLLVLLALILGATFALGGLIFGAVNVVSVGFAAILLGLAVDYAVVHYQEALAHPALSISQVRRAIAPSIFWAAITTIAAFLVLNFGGLPGLAQLGTLVGVGIALAAVVMIFAFLPPLFPDRRQPKDFASPPAEAKRSAPENLFRSRTVFVFTGLLIATCIAVLFSGLPKLDATANALRPRQSEAYETLDSIKQHLNQSREPLWLILSGKNENKVAARLKEIQPKLENAVSNRLLAGFTLPTALWPQPQNQASNQTLARQLAGEQNSLRSVALKHGFSESALALTTNVLGTWREAGQSTNVFWPQNPLSKWIFQKFAARSPAGDYALGLLQLRTNHPAADSALTARLESQLPPGAWLSGWELLGGAVLRKVQSNVWKLVLPIVALVLFSLWLAFRKLTETLLSLGVLFLSGLCVLAVMKLAGWSWNLLSLMALPLILGTGVDYSIFMQLALRRHHGDLHIAHRSVGRALLLCGGTAISGFGFLGFSNNIGMASLGRVCAIGIAANMFISVLLLPAWWKNLTRTRTNSSPKTGPSALYRSELWRLGLWLVRVLPESVCFRLADFGTDIYCQAVTTRREIVVQNLLPVLNHHRALADQKARELFRHFGRKIIALWRFESGLAIQNLFGESEGWHFFTEARAQKRGVLLLTPHLGNWEFGAPWLAQQGEKLQVITLAEPGRRFTDLRRAARSRWGIETLVIGEDLFAFVEIIRRLEAGATVALLVDRPPLGTGITVNFFGRPFVASIAAAELARASGCVLLPVCLPCIDDKYAGHILPSIP